MRDLLLCAKHLFVAARNSVASHNAVLEAQTLGDGRRQAAGFKTSESRPDAKIAVILHRMWVDGSTYRWTETQPIAAQT
jgi:hypothetical protein